MLRLLPPSDRETVIVTAAITDVSIARRVHGTRQSDPSCANGAMSVQETADPLPDEMAEQSEVAKPSTLSKSSDVAEEAAHTPMVAIKFSRPEPAPIRIRALRQDDNEGAIREMWIGGCEYLR